MAEKKSGGGFLWWALTSPVTIVLGGLMLYYGVQAYVLENEPWQNKIMMVGVAALWILWLVFKNLIKFLLLALLIAGAFYSYYRYENSDKISCKEQGRIWNEEAGVCEDKKSWKDKLAQVWQSYVNDDSPVVVNKKQK